MTIAILAFYSLATQAQPASAQRAVCVVKLSFGGHNCWIDWIQFTRNESTGQAPEALVSRDLFDDGLGIDDLESRWKTACVLKLKWSVEHGVPRDA